MQHQVTLLPYKNMWPKIGHENLICDGVRIIGDVVLGDQVSVWFNTVIRGDVNYIRIGDRTNIQDGSILHVENKLYPLILGEGITVGHGVILHGCTIGSHCLIGMGAVVMNDCEIGAECIIGAGCLVPEHTKIPPRSLVIGMPGKIRRELTEEEVGRLHHSATKYVDYMQTHRSSWPQPDWEAELKKLGAP